MIRFYATVFINRLSWLELSASRAHDCFVEKGADSKADKEHGGELTRELNAIWDACSEMGMKASPAMCRSLTNILRKPERRSYRVIEEYLRDIRSEIIQELGEYDFTYLERGKAGFFEQDELFGKPVRTAFPEAKADIKNAGNCIAAGLDTAAVFHLCRVAELGLRAMARHLKVKLNTPLEFSEWGKVIGAMDKKLTAIRAGPRGGKKVEALEFYHEVLRDFNMLKDVWRNEVMHTRRDYGSDDALDLLRRVRALMVRLAGKFPP